ncbi:M56 family peptidase [Arthrobacter agilis]|uniref:M56 family metallopeptidase n=1 Tax=Arthrobacter agilis TaxID=37921 RepID=UPI000B35C00F|nr:M56 family metallopeptidase [Arthrobacter agilis]OUM44988.1 peptidase M48 [Arthrobacter agilis]PPB46945.1 peptidase M48 [Arthrobacter agilis]TPV23461.1 M56 family peptidase [Arthrobacter agilis]VDR31848.1 heat shock protein HtpX [Arthrobacter agilis]
MFWASYLLAALAIILAWPAPIALSRASWPARAPFTAMVLWQSIALGGGLSMIGAMLVWGLEPLGDNLVSASAGFLRILVSDEPAASLGVVHVFAISAATLLFGHLVSTLILTFIRIRRQRSRHRDMLTLLSSPAADQPATLVISHPVPVAYCLPGGARSVTVMSDGLMDLLTRAELDAVLTHESAHLHQRHHLLLWAFAAWRSALPWLPTSLLAQRAVSELIEMLADDEALRHVDEPTLVRAIAIVGSGALPDQPDTLNDPLAEDAGAPAARGTTDVTGGTADARSTAHRLQRLLTPLPPLSRVQQGLALSVAGLLLIVPPALLVAPELIG